MASGWNDFLIKLLKQLFSKNGKKAIDNLDSLDTKFDINLTTLRNDLRGVDNRTLTDLYNKAYDSAADLVKISLDRDNVGLLKPTDLDIDATTKDLGIKIDIDNVGIAKDSTIIDLRDTLKPTRTTPTQDLSAYSLAGGSTYNIDKTNLDTYSAIVTTVRATYDASATAGIRVRWLYSMDGTNYDSVEDSEAQGNYYDLSFTAGATRQATILIPIFAPYVRIQIVNLDATYAATIDVWTCLMR